MAGGEHGSLHENGEAGGAERDDLLEDFRAVGVGVGAAAHLGEAEEAEQARRGRRVAPGGPLEVADGLVDLALTLREVAEQFQDVRVVRGELVGAAEVGGGLVELADAQVEQPAIGPGGRLFGDEFDGPRQRLLDALIDVRVQRGRPDLEGDGVFLVPRRAGFRQQDAIAQQPEADAGTDRQDEDDGDEEEAFRSPRGGGRHATLREQRDGVV